MSRRHRRYHRPRGPLVASLAMPGIELPRFALPKLEAGRATGPALTIASFLGVVAILIAQVSPVIHQDTAQRGARTAISATVAAPAAFGVSGDLRLERDAVEMTVETATQAPASAESEPPAATPTHGSTAIPITMLPASPTAQPVRGTTGPRPTATPQSGPTTSADATTSGTTAGTSSSSSSTSGSTAPSTSTPPPSSALPLPIDTSAVPSLPPLPTITTPPSPLGSGGL